VLGSGLSGGVDSGRPVSTVSPAALERNGHGDRLPDPGGSVGTGGDGDLEPRCRGHGERTPPDLPLNPGGGGDDTGDCGADCGDGEGPLD